jgi:hypothetical protein
MRGNFVCGLTEDHKFANRDNDKSRVNLSNVSESDLSWFHKWIEEELQTKSISEIMAIAVKMKTLLDEKKVE